MRLFNLSIKVLVLLLILGCYPVSLLNKTTAANYVETYWKSPMYVDYLEKELAAEIDSYIKEIAPTSELSGDSVLANCKKYELEAAFVLAQGHIESHFGTRGVAARTNSVFNVGTFDNGVILYRYPDPNLSIKPYASLLVRKYLVNGKEERDLLKPRMFVNYKGKRYASLRVYEYRVRKVYEEIKATTKIDSLQKEIEKIVKEPEYYNANVSKLFELISIKNKKINS